MSFRGWYYFRMGWTTYFAFILAAINTLTVTYFLAIEKAPVLQEIFPTFVQYVLIVVSIGMPILIAVGYVHFKNLLHIDPKLISGLKVIHTKLVG